MSRFRRSIFVSLFVLVIGQGVVYSQGDPFVYFDVLPGENHTVSVQWTIRPGMDSLTVAIERRRNKGAWERLTICAVDSSHLYSYRDLTPGDSTVYYRVSQVSRNGSITHSRLHWIQFHQKGNLYIWPSPAVNVLHVRTPCLNGTIDLVSPGGKVLLKININDFITDIYTGQLSKGIYFLRVRYSNEIIMGKFIKE